VIYSYNKSQRDALISQIYIWNRTLHVSDSFSVHHPESSTVHTAIHTGYADCLLASCQHNLYDIYHFSVDICVTKFLLIMQFLLLQRKAKCALVQALRLCTGHTARRGSRGIGKGKVHPCTGTEALYRPYGP
jgi:hypothetical protein